MLQRRFRTVVLVNPTPRVSIKTGSGMGAKPPGVAEPTVMLSKPIWLDVPPKSIEKAVPANDDPIGINGQNRPLGSGAPSNGVYIPIYKIIIFQ